MTKIILASTSKYRKELLLRLGLEFDCIAPNVDEDIHKKNISNPLELAETLGKLKAMAVYEKHQDALVIGSDQLAECNGTILSKPKTIEKAVEQLIFLNNKEHRLITSYTVLFNGKSTTKTNITTLKMRKLSEPQIKNYLRKDIPFDCAGSYKLELNGISLFANIETTDQTAIIGLPLISLANTLNEMGITVPPEN